MKKDLTWYPTEDLKEEIEKRELIIKQQEMIAQKLSKDRKENVK